MSSKLGPALHVGESNVWSQPSAAAQPPKVSAPPEIAEGVSAPQSDVRSRSHRLPPPGTLPASGSVTSPAALPRLPASTGDSDATKLPALTSLPKQPGQLGGGAKLQPIVPTAPPQELTDTNADSLKPRQPLGAHVPAKPSPRASEGTQSSGRSTTGGDDDSDDSEETGSIEAPEPPDDDLDDGEDEAERELQRHAAEPVAQ